MVWKANTLWNSWLTLAVQFWIWWACWPISPDNQNSNIHKIIQFTKFLKLKNENIWSKISHFSKKHNFLKNNIYSQKIIFLLLLFKMLKMSVILLESIFTRVFKCQDILLFHWELNQAQCWAWPWHSPWPCEGWYDVQGWECSDMEVFSIWAPCWAQRLLLDNHLGHFGTLLLS